MIILFFLQTVFDPMFISVYNLFYTALPVLGVGIFEQDVSDKHSLEYPKLYTPGLNNALFNTKEFVKSVIHGVFSSLILFLIPYGKNMNLNCLDSNLTILITYLRNIPRCNLTRGSCAKRPHAFRGSRCNNFDY